MREQSSLRANIYRFLSALFREEQSRDSLEKAAAVRFPETAPWGEAGAAWNRCAAALSPAGLEALAADYARVFLGAGLADAAAAFPYESVYTSPKRIIMQDAWSRMHALLQSQSLALTGPADLMEDHVSVLLDYMARLCETAEAKEQTAFLELHLCNWIPRFCVDVEQYAETDFYKAAAKLLNAFVAWDRAELKTAPVRPAAEQPAEAKPEAAGQGKARGVSLTWEQAEAWFADLRQKYAVYGPATDAQGAVRFLPLENLGRIVNDRQSDFSPKEVYYPISQTLFRFDENSYAATVPKPEKPVLILAHACDVNAIRRLDNILLKNGGQPDLYYQALRENVRFGLLECPAEGFPGCWCVSMGTNRAEDCVLALRLTASGVLARSADSALLPPAGKDCDYAPAFVEQNARAARLPRVESVQELQRVFDLPFWKEYNDKCISCGGCNTVCPTCSCYETADYLDQENSRKGERRRVWASCMIPEFTRTAGGHVARPKPENLMRFKALHKVFDYRARFGGQEHMCVGCGRCVLRCPEDIDFLDTINRLHDETEKLIAEQEAKA